jgi:hypothetical protein
MRNALIYKASRQIGPLIMHQPPDAVMAVDRRFRAGRPESTGGAPPPAATAHGGALRLGFFIVAIPFARTPAVRENPQRGIG